MCPIDGRFICLMPRVTVWFVLCTTGEAVAKFFVLCQIVGLWVRPSTEAAGMTQLVVNPLHVPLEVILPLEPFTAMPTGLKQLPSKETWSTASLELQCTDLTTDLQDNQKNMLVTFGHTIVDAFSSCVVSDYLFVCTICHRTHSGVLL